MSVTYAEYYNTLWIILRKYFCPDTLTALLANFDIFKQRPTILLPENTKKCYSNFLSMFWVLERWIKPVLLMFPSLTAATGRWAWTTTLPDLTRPPVPSLLRSLPGISAILSRARIGVSRDVLLNRVGTGMLSGNVPCHTFHITRYNLPLHKKVIFFTSLFLI